jgi:Type VI secretion system effector, Hcp
MMRISTLCLLSSTLAALALFASGANAASHNYRGGRGAGDNTNRATIAPRKAGENPAKNFKSTSGTKTKSTAAKNRKVKVKDIPVTKKIDKSSPTIMKSTTSGKATGIEGESKEDRHKDW